MELLVASKRQEMHLVAITSLTFEIHGEKGSIVFNYERRDELQVFLRR